MNGLLTSFLGAASAAFVDPGDVGEQLNNNSGLLAALIALSMALVLSTYKKKNDEAKAKEAERAAEAKEAERAAEAKEAAQVAEEKEAEQAAEAIAGIVTDEDSTEALAAEGIAETEESPETEGTADSDMGKHYGR